MAIILFLLLTGAIFKVAAQVKFLNVTVVGNPSTECLVKADDVLEIITHSSEGGCVIPFEQLKLPVRHSLSGKVLTFTMEFLVKPNNDVGCHGGIYYGNHSFGRHTSGNFVVDWIDRAENHGFRFYETGLFPNLTILPPQKEEPVKNLKIIIKNNGGLFVTSGISYAFGHTKNDVHLLDQPYVGFWAFDNNHLRISHFDIRRYLGDK